MSDSLLDQANRQVDTDADRCPATLVLERAGRPLMQQLADETVLARDQPDDYRQEVAGAEDVIERARRGHA